MTDSNCIASNKRHPQTTSSEQKWQIVEDVDKGARKARNRNSVLRAHEQHRRTRSQSSDHQATRLHYSEGEELYSDDSSSEDTRSEATSPVYQTLLPSLKFPFEFKKRETIGQVKSATAPIAARKCSSPQKQEYRSKLYDENILNIPYSRYTGGIHGRERCIADLFVQNSHDIQSEKPSQLLQWM